MADMRPDRISLQFLKGISAAPGLAEGPAIVWQKEGIQAPRRFACDPVVELARIKSAKMFF